MQGQQERRGSFAAYFDVLKQYLNADFVRTIKILQTVHMVSTQIVFEVLCAVDAIMDERPLTVVCEDLDMQLDYIKIFSTLLGVRTHTKAIRVNDRKQLISMVGTPELKTLCVIPDDVD